MGFQSFCFLELMDAFDKHDAKVEEMEQAAKRSREERYEGQRVLSSNHSVSVRNDVITLLQEVKYRDTMIASLSAENKRLEELVLRFAKAVCGEPLPQKESKSIQALARKVKEQIPPAIPEIPATIGFSQHIPPAPLATTDAERKQIDARSLEMVPCGIPRKLCRFPELKKHPQKMTYAIIYLGISQQNMLLANIIFNIAKHYYSTKVLASTSAEIKETIRNIPVLTNAEKKYLVNNIEEILREKHCFTRYTPEAVKIGASAFEALEPSDDFQVNRNRWEPHNN